MDRTTAALLLLALLTVPPAGRSAALRVLAGRLLAPPLGVPHGEALPVNPGTPESRRTGGLAARHRAGSKGVIPPA